MCPIPCSFCHQWIGLSWHPSSSRLVVSRLASSAMCWLQGKMSPQASLPRTGVGETRVEHSLLSPTETAPQLLVSTLWLVGNDLTQPPVGCHNIGCEKLWRHGIHSNSLLWLLLNCHTACVSSFKRQVNLGCSCSDCTKLQVFLKDPVKSEAWFKVTQAKRSHLQSQLHNRFCDTAHMMDRSGAPQTLVVVKVNCSYKTELEEHQRKLCFLDHLQPLYSQLISCREDQPSAKRLRVQSDASALTWLD